LQAAGNDLRLVDAAQRGDRETVRALLAQQADVNEPQADGATALAWAVHRDDLEMASELIAAGADVNAANDYGVTPLMLACTNANPALVKQLLDAGANPNAAQWTGETVLMTCANSGNAEAVKLLLEGGADVNAAEKEKGQTALMWAVAERHPEIVHLLVQHGANVKARSKLMQLPEPFTLPCTVNEPCLSGKRTGSTYEDTVHLPKTSGGFTALLFAAQQGDLESGRILLGAGADVDEATEEDGTALVVAAASGHESMALYLLEQGADPNATDAYGITPLHYALHDGLLAVTSYKSMSTDSFGWLRPNLPALAKALLAKGADPNARIAKDFPPYDYAPIARSNGNNLPQVSLVGATPFMLAAANGDVEMMRVLVEGRADSKLSTIEKTNALMLAAGLAHERENRSPEEERRLLEAVKLAVQLGADVNAVNADGRTALHGAAFHGRNEMIKYLAAQGANLEAKDMYGQTPLTIALGDPEGLVYRQLGGGRYDYSFRQPRPSFGGLRKDTISTADLLVQLGATPFTGKFRDRSGE
jgi:ankyrin repeat protein